AFKNRDISSITLTTRTFNIPRITLRNYLSGYTKRCTTRPSTIREIANLFLEKRGTTLASSFISSSFLLVLEIETSDLRLRQIKTLFIPTTFLYIKGEQEGRILLAIQAFKNREISSIRETARRFNIPNSTLALRLYSIQNHAISRILSMDLRGVAPRPSITFFFKSVELPRFFRSAKIGLQNLLNDFSKRYNYERAKCEDPKIITEWFNLVQKTILQFGIDPNDIYNFDETGFAIGLTVTVKVITRSEYYGRRALL
ncbi:uncharacterized protein N7500_000176, partial [Penicillium coprophilum]|uniref:uncharacterized protein n=1 Tax=Penicillium coprophilum TaxID=36646 RepID=UPI002382D53E